MNQTFILQNQDKLFWGKGKEWVDGYDANSLFKTPHKDEAVNQLVEVSSKDYKQRIKIIECAANEKNLPIIDSEIMPAPLPKVPKPPKAGEDLFVAKVDEVVEEIVEDDELEFSADADGDEDKLQSTLL